MPEQTIKIIANEIADYIAIKLAYPVNNYSTSGGRICLCVGNTWFQNKEKLKIFIWDDAKVLCHPPGPPGPPDPDRFLIIDFSDPNSWEVLTKYLCAVEYTAAEINSVVGKLGTGAVSTATLYGKALNDFAKLPIFKKYQTP